MQWKLYAGVLCGPPSSEDQMSCALLTSGGASESQWDSSLGKLQNGHSWPRNITPGFWLKIRSGILMLIPNIIGGNGHYKACWGCGGCLRHWQNLDRLPSPKRSGHEDGCLPVSMFSAIVGRFLNGILYLYFQLFSSHFIISIYFSPFLSFRHS